MLKKRKPRERRVRLYVLALTVVFLFGLACLRLMEFQIVQGAEYRERADASTVSSVVVKAARGEIVDRYGRPLAVNKVGFNIVFDKAFLEEGTENRIIADLIDLMRRQKEDWLDTLPITKKQPYTFLDNSDDVERAKKTIGLNSYATAQNCMDELIEKCEISGYSPEMTRLIAGVRYEMLRTGFSLYNRYTFAQDVSSATVSRLKENSVRFKGVDIAEESIRKYVSGTIAPHIIGMIGPVYAEEYQSLKEKGYLMNDMVGKSGIESAFESDLRGKNGVRQVVQNIQGEVVGVADKVEAVPGNTVMLTIDKVFQKEVQDILQAHVQSDGRAGSVVVLDCKTGEILAIATYPSYNIKDYTKNYNKMAKDSRKPLLNRALFGEYRPGSTYKTAVATAALVEGTITPYSTHYCRGGSGAYTYSDLHMDCFNHGGIYTLDVLSALKYSCNSFFADTGRRLGIDKLDKYARMLGLGADTGLEIACSNGALAGPERSAQFGSEWHDGDTCQASIGQSDNAVTPLQMASQAMTIANKGVRYDTHIVKSVRSYNYDRVIRETEPVVGDRIKNKNDAFDTVIHGMELVANRYSDLTQYSFQVAMKTGTPQVTSEVTDSAVVAFAPSEDADIAIGGFIERGNLSRLMVSKIIDAYYKSKKHTKQKPQEYGELLA